jgi:hypothetical protein
MTPLDIAEAFLLRELGARLPQCTALPQRTNYGRTSAIELTHLTWDESVTLHLGTEGRVRCVDVVLDEAAHALDEWRRGQTNT